MNDQRPESEMTTGAVASEDKFSERLGTFRRRGLLQRVLDWMYGYDYFISYKWSDGRIYALALAEQLRKRGFDCFLDSEEYAKGDNWKIVGERALKKTTRLVLVGSPEVHQSYPVLRELKIFKETNKDIIPINFDGSLNGPGTDQSPLAPFLDTDAIFIPEPMGRLSTGPSPSTVEGLEKSFKKQRSGQKRARALRIACGVFAVLILLASWNGWRSYQQHTAAMVNRLTSDFVAVPPDKLSREFSDLLIKMKKRTGWIIAELRSRQGEFYPPKGDENDDAAKDASDDTAKKDASDDAAKDDSDRFAKQRAHAAIALVHFEEAAHHPTDDSEKYDLAAQFLDLNGRPEPLAQFAARCQTPGGLKRQQVIDFAEYVIGKSISSGDQNLALVGYSALLGVGEYQDEGSLPNEFVSQLTEWYRQHPSAAIHSACGWLLGRESNGLAVVDQLNEELALPLQEVSLEPSGKYWFVVKLQREVGDEKGDRPVEYLTFVVFKGQQPVFAMSDRETSVGVCGQLGEFLHYYDEQPQRVDPVNDATFDDGKRVCDELSSRLPKTLRAHLPDQSEWAVAWGNATKDPRRRFQFGRDSVLLPRYAKVGVSTAGVSRPSQVAMHRPSTTGMFDMHGNVAEWTVDLSDNGPKGRMRGGAVGQDSELCEWNSPVPHASHKGFRISLSRSIDAPPARPSKR